MNYKTRDTLMAWTFAALFGFGTIIPLIDLIVGLFT